MGGGEIRRSRLEYAAVVAAAGVAGVLAWVVFSILPPTQVLVGTDRVDAWAPVWYQVSIFPAFASFVAAAGLDSLTGRGRWWPRAALAAILMLLAAARLSDGIAISGHGACSAALIAEALGSPRRQESAWVGALAAASLLVTAWYKLMVWGDAKWFAISLALGASLGVAAALVQRPAHR